MYYYNQEEQEYKRFILEVGIKMNEMIIDYNKLSEKNKYCFSLWLEEIVRTSIALRML